MHPTALLIIDVQKDVVANAARTNEVIANINYLVSKARSSHVPVIWVQHSDDYLLKGSTGWEFVDELQPAADEIRIYKTRANSFLDTDLKEQLNGLETKSLIITGAQTNYCIDATSNAGVEMGYQVTVVSDAHTTEDSDTDKALDIIEAKNKSFAQIGQVLKTSEWVGDHTTGWFMSRGPLARQVVSEMQEAGVLLYAGGLEEAIESAFGIDETGNLRDRITTSGEYLGGLTIINVDTEEEAKMWGAKVGQACGWPQEIRRIKN